jgi:hypothetical protein
MARTWGKPPPSPLYYSLWLSTGATSKWHFVPRLPSGPEIPTARTLVTLGPHNFVCRSLITMIFKKNCNHCWKLFNGMSHATWMRENRVNFRFLMVGNQITSLTPGLSFVHNMCFRCPNGSYEPILDIYVSIAFQWYKLFEPMGFDPYNRALKIQESIPTFTMRVHLGVWGFIPSHSLHSWEHVRWLSASLLLTTLQPPYLGHEPKARVVTSFLDYVLPFKNTSWWIYCNLLSIF